MTFLLDTNIVSYSLRDFGGVKKRLLEHRPFEIGVSAISIAELKFGAYKRGSKKLHRLIDTFLANVIQVPFSPQAACRYGEIAAQLEKNGAPIGMADAMIAAHALELGWTLVSHNVKHFSRVDKLKVEDWV